MSVKRLLKILFIVFLLSYGFLYFSYKYYTPLLGGSDYFQYLGMYSNPLNVEAASSPWIYRQFHAVITHILYVSGFFYETEISFKVTIEEQRFFFAAILSNYLAFIISSALFFWHFEKLDNFKQSFGALAASVLLLLSFSFQTTTLTGLSEGWSWLIILGAYVAFRKNKFTFFLLFISVSILQREMISIILFVIVFCYSIKDRELYIKYILTCFVAFVTYILIRLYLFPVQGEYDNQLSITSQVYNVLNYFIPSKSVLFQGVLSQNLLILMIFLLVSSIEIFEKHKYSVIPLLLAGFVIYVISIGSGVGNNVGRILALLSPIYALIISEMLLGYIPSKSKLMDTA